jgi:hypothetical protein
MVLVNPNTLANNPPAIRHRTFWPSIDIDWREFTKFPKLPPELRLRIWSHSLPDPRIVTIEQSLTRAKDYRISCQNRVPGTLLVNRESREVALKRYSLRFTTFENVYGPPVYFDFNRDVICLKRCDRDWWNNFNDEFNEDLSLVTRIMIENLHCSLNQMILRAEPFRNMCSLGLVRENLQPRLTLNEEMRVFSGLRACIHRAEGLGARFKEGDAKLLERLDVYFISRFSVFDLEQGVSDWEP